MKLMHWLFDLQIMYDTNYFNIFNHRVLIILKEADLGFLEEKLQ